MAKDYQPKYQNSWALVIGVDQYQDSKLPPLLTAVKGAQAVAKMLEEELKFPSENIILLENEEATQRAIRRAFTDPISRSEKVGSDDRVLIYFGGHGLTFDTAEGDVGCIAPYDTEITFLDTTIPMDELTRLANRSHAKHILFLIDACFSGFATTRQSDTGIIRHVNSYLKRTVRQVITAGTREQVVSDVHGPEGHSIFTGFVLEGLQGGAPAPGGILRAFHLAGYLQDQVGQHTRSRQTPQYATLMGSQGGDFIFKVREMGELPAWLLAACESEDPAERLMAVGQLRQLAETRQKDNDAPVYEKLQLMADDPDSMISSSARGALRELMPSTQVAPIERLHLLDTQQEIDIKKVRKPRILGILTFTDGPAKGGQYEITISPTVIGREPDCQLMIWDDNISRRHAQFEYRDDALWLVDLESTNGTYVNDQPVTEPYLLQEGDRLEIGRTICFITFDEAHPPITRMPTAVQPIKIPKEISEASQLEPTRHQQSSATLGKQQQNLVAVRPVHRLEEHQKHVHGVAWSPDSQLLASVSADRQAIIWRAASGEIIQKIEGCEGALLAVAWSPDGQYLATAGGDHTIILWDTEKWTATRKMEGHLMDIFSVAFSPDSNMLASGAKDNQIVIWDVQLGLTLHTLKEHTGFIFDLSWTPDGRELASASGDSRVIIWDVKNAEPIKVLHEHEGSVEAVAWSPTARWLATAGAKQIIIWENKIWTEYRRIEQAAKTLVWSPNNQWLAGAASSGAVIWAARSGDILHELKGHTRDVLDLVWSPDGKYLATASEDRTVIIWEIEVEDN